MTVHNFPLNIVYYRNIQLANVRSRISIRFGFNPVVYGIRCRVTSMIYISSTFEPRYRLPRHLEYGDKSNKNLQEAISKYGLEYFNLYIFEVLQINPLDSNKVNAIRLRALEQKGH